MTDLTVHKNTLERRKRKETREEVIDAARQLAKDSPVSEKINGYVVMVWDEDNAADAYWSGGNIPTSLIGEYFKITMARMIAKRDAGELLEDI